MTRILVTTDAVGGVWRYSLEVCASWAERGVATVLAVLGPPPGDAQRREAAAIRGLVLVETGLELDWTARDAAALENTAQRLAELALSFAVDSVHLHAPALVGGASWPTPVVAVAHSCLLTWWQAMRAGPPPDSFIPRIEATARGLRRAGVVIAPSAAFAEALRSAYRLGRAIEIVHNGRRPMPLPSLPRRPGVFTAGRLWDEAKNLAALDSAAAWLDAPVSAAGATLGPDGATMRLAHIRHVGVLHDRQLAEHLASNTVFAGLSLYEPFGLSVLEAAQAGMALVLADIPVFRELWDEAAIFVDPRDAASIRAGLSAALREPAHLARAAKVRALNYQRETMGGETLLAHSQMSLALT